MRAGNEFSHVVRGPNPHDELTQRSYRTLREAGIGNSGKFVMGAETVPVPSRAGINVVPDRVANQGEITGARRDVESLRAELKCLTNFMAGSDVQWTPGEEPFAVPRQRAALAHERASARVDEAASLLIRVASERAETSPNWDKTDEAVADLLYALLKQTGPDWDRLRTRHEAANSLRLARQLAQAEKERMALRRFRTRHWRRFALRWMPLSRQTP
jgi:hypothetical protein